MYTVSTEVINSLAWVPNHHYGGIFAMLKLSLHQILPASLENIIFLDTDLIILEDLVALWEIFSEMKADQCLAMVENQSGPNFLTLSRHFVKCHRLVHTWCDFVEPMASHWSWYQQRCFSCAFELFTLACMGVCLAIGHQRSSNVRKVDPHISCRSSLFSLINIFFLIKHRTFSMLCMSPNRSFL